MFDIPVYDENGVLLGTVRGNKAMYELLVIDGVEKNFTCGTRAPDTDPNQQELPLDPSESIN